MILIPVTGYPSSGKTTLLRQLAVALPEGGLAVEAVNINRPSKMQLIRELTQYENQGAEIILFEWMFNFKDWARLHHLFHQPNWLFVYCNVPKEVCANRVAVRLGGLKRPKEYTPKILAGKIRKLDTEVRQLRDTIGVRVCTVNYNTPDCVVINKVSAYIKLTLKLIKEGEEND